MSFAEFAGSAARDPKPPAEAGAALRALWLEARGDWPGAHAAAQEDASGSGAWVHAYLHRKEGDLDNAAYWYARAGRTRPADGVTLPKEWEQIARELLGDQVKA